MARKFMFLLFCLFAVVGLSMTACEVDGDGDADGTTSGTSGTTDTSGSTSGTSGTSGDTSVTTNKYYFVRVNDQSTNTGTNPGADLDAISITKAGTGRRAYVTRVEDYKPVNEGDISGVSIIPENIIGEPTAFGTPFDPANAGSDKSCDLGDENFVALGGVGGHIIVSFGDDHVENGDTLTVYEIGNCDGEGKADPVEVQVSVSSNVDGNWITVFTAAAGPVMSKAIDGLPAQ
jgi:hypothetical protein